MQFLAIAVHPDDETLGCGATLLKHAAAGDDIHWVIITSAEGGVYSEEQVVAQREQVATVQEAYGFRSLQWLKFPAAQLETKPLSSLVGAIRDAVAKVRPEVVFVPNRSDVHSDHRVVFEACMAVLKSFYMAPLGVRRVLACEVPSETDAIPALAERAFAPQVFVDVSDTLQRKLEIMSLFHEQVQPGFLPRGLSAIEALARHRGASIGVRYAEAFMLMREIA